MACGGATLNQAVIHGWLWWRTSSKSPGNPSATALNRAGSHDDYEDCDVRRIFFLSTRGRLQTENGKYSSVHSQLESQSENWRALKKLLFFVTGLIMLKIKHQLNFLPNCTWNLERWLVKNGILKLGRGASGWTQKKLTIRPPIRSDIPLPMEEACPRCLRIIAFLFFENLVISSPEADALKGDALYPQDPLKPYAHRAITSVKSQHAPENRNTQWPKKT